LNNVVVGIALLTIVFVILSYTMANLLHWRPLQNATISNIKSDNFKALQKPAKSDSFVTDNAQHAQLW
jgi:hypothetical protein